MIWEVWQDSVGTEARASSLSFYQTHAKHGDLSSKRSLAGALERVATVVMGQQRVQLV